VATIAIFGGTGYAGGAIRDEALRRGHTVISVSRKEAGRADRPGLISRAGDLHDPAVVDHMAAEADVLVVAIRPAEQDGIRLADAVGPLAKAAAEHRSRLGFVGGAGSLHVAEGGSEAPGEATGRYRIGGDVLLSDADGNSNISGADYATAFVDEIDKPAHRRQRFSVAY
jgi:putative NADH-flavin reductase